MTVKPLVLVHIVVATPPQHGHAISLQGHDKAQQGHITFPTPGNSLDHLTVVA